MKYYSKLIILFFSILIMVLLLKENKEQAILLKSEFFTQQWYNETTEYQYYIKNGKEIKHGYYSTINLPRKCNKLKLLGYSEFGGYSNGKKSGQWVTLAYNFKFFKFYKNNLILKSETFNKKGKLVSECIFKNGLPFNGNILTFQTSLKGTNYWLQVFKKGKLIKENDYYE